jgi:hypothetical protein
MSAYAMKPRFADYAGYQVWCVQWRDLYAGLTQDIRRSKRGLKAAQRDGGGAGLHKPLRYQRAMAYKLMGLRDEARQRWQRIRDMRRQIAAQMARLPLTVADCTVVDFHFNRGHNEFPDLPMWVVKAKGQTYYVHHVTAICAWTTRERPSGATKGLLRFRHCDLHIDDHGEARITVAVRVPTAQSA